MSQLSVCEMPECENDAPWSGVCRTHYDHWANHGDQRVQAVIEGREHRLDLETDLDWEYLTDDQMKAVERGVADAYYDNDNHLNWHDWQNLQQEMLIWAAAHKTEVEGFTSMKMLRRHIKRRSIEVHRTQWSADRKITSWDAIVEDTPEGF